MRKVIETTDSNQPNKREWTIMVYLAGDNNLNTEMAYTLQRIKDITKENKNINLFAYFDGFSDNVPTLYCDFSDFEEEVIKYYRSYNIKDKLIKRERRWNDDFNENSASMNNVINFVDWCVNKVEYTTEKGESIKGRRANKYAMIFSGHTFGFLDWGLFGDQKANYHMTLSKLKWLFERITFKKDELLKIAEQDQYFEQKLAEKGEDVVKPWTEERLKERTTEILGQPIDLLGFDSCIMSTLEIGSQFTGLAKTMVASEGSIPSAGWNYTQILLSKIKDPTTEIKDVAISFVDEFIKQQNKIAVADISVDLAAWDLTVLEDLQKSFGVMSKNLLNCFTAIDKLEKKEIPTEDENLVFNQIKRLLVQVHTQCQTYLFEQHVDLGDFCQLMINEIDSLEKELTHSKITPITEVKKSCTAVIKNLKRCVLLSGFSGSDFQFSNGISLFFPWSLDSYNSAKKDYEKLRFINDNESGKSWNDFLKKYLDKVTRRNSRELTTTIIKDTESFIYESYTFLDKNRKKSDSLMDKEHKQAPDSDKQAPDSDKQAPDSDKQAPDSDKQAPDSDKQAPDSDKLFSTIGIFLTRFMRLKNFQSNWNRAGFIFSNKQIVLGKKEAKDNRSVLPLPKKPGDVIANTFIEK